jgi:TRAP transporter TAXI family solute receptor
VLAEITRVLMKPYGWDVQICNVCAGGPRAARLMAAKANPAKLPPNEEQPNPPDGPLDVGATGTQFIWWAYQGSNAFAQDKEGPRRDLRLIANVQQPSYFLVAVRADSPITDLRQIVENRIPVKFMLADIMADAHHLTTRYNLTEEKLKAFGGEIRGTGPKYRGDSDVVAGWASLVGAPEYSYWFEMSQKYNLRFLPLPLDLVEQWAKEGNMEVRDAPLMYRGMDKSFPTVAKTGAVLYGRTDTPDDFAYTLAKALDEQQDILQWNHMNFSYNKNTVWKAYGVPLHPGAEKYYREKGYMK